jgi:hypothetical protein
MASFIQSVAQQLDKWVLYTMNWRLPDSFENSYQQAPTFETVLTRTTVDSQKTAEYQLSAPGEHLVWLNTMEGELRCRVRVKPAADPSAPLILYHHGFNEIPYTSSWRRIFRQPLPGLAHTACIQAPFHNNWSDPFDKGFASLQNVYQMFASSIRIMQKLQLQFEAQGAAYTIVAGVSWGGITSLIYEGLFGHTRAVVPMLASPNLAQVMWDAAQMLMRPLPVSQAVLADLLDFTPYFHRCDSRRVFPLMGENDLFFRLETHADTFQHQPLITIPEGHITAFWRADRLRQHIFEVLSRSKTAHS